MYKQILLFIIIILFLFYLLKPSSNKNNKNAVHNAPKNNNKKLVLYYANWCIYSQQFLPIWKELCNEVNIKTQEIDCASNKCSDIEGFPTLILINENNEKIKYDGPREKDKIIQFINDN